MSTDSFAVISTDVSDHGTPHRNPAVNGRVVDLIPANVEAADAFLNENRKGPEKIIEHLNNARPRPLSPNYLQVATIEQEMMQAIFSGTAVADAVANACAEIDALNQ